jgi:dihydrofolate reductase
MRKIKLQMQISLDGYVAGPNGEMDWMVWDWDEVLKKYATELTNSADTFLLGRKTGEGMAVYWPTVASNPESKEEDLWIADKLNTLPKVVFSKTVSAIHWTNVSIARDVEKEVARLKQQHGKDMILYGGAGIVSTFIQQNLIDEYHLFVNPVILGSGKTIFNDLQERLKLNLIQITPSSTGIVVLLYQPGGKV